MKKHTTTLHGMLIIKYKPEKEGILMSEIKKHEVEIACVNSKTSIIAAGKQENINELTK
jgi:acyl transferase domain-containing protein